MPAVGVCLIVKNESRVIVRCLDSLKQFAKFVCVEDTGSTDGTQNVIKDWMMRNGVSGEVYDRPWYDFANNRSSVLAKLRGHDSIDYAIIIDADDEFVIEDSALFFDGLARMSHDAYKIKIKGQGIEYFRTQVVRNNLPFRYRGVLHEFIEGPEQHTVATLPGCHMRSNREGARSADPLKYAKDAAVLQAALDIEQDPFLISRYTFYLAQSYRDSGNIEKAIEYYLKRVQLGFWSDERFVAMYQAAALMEQLPTYDEQSIVSAYQQAIEISPHRVEGYHALARFLRLRKRYLDAVKVGMKGLTHVGNIPEGLFVETWVYQYGLLDELVVSNYWAGAFQNSLDLSVKLMSVETLPVALRERVWQNARFAKLKLHEKLGVFDSIEQTFVQKMFKQPDRTQR